MIIPVILAVVFLISSSCSSLEYVPLDETEQRNIENGRLNK